MSKQDMTKKKKTRTTTKDRCRWTGEPDARVNQMHTLTYGD